MPRIRSEWKPINTMPKDTWCTVIIAGYHSDTGNPYTPARVMKCPEGWNTPAGIIKFEDWRPTHWSSLDIDKVPANPIVREDKMPRIRKTTHPILAQLKRNSGVMVGFTPVTEVERFKIGDVCGVNCGSVPLAHLKGKILGFRNNSEYQAILYDPKSDFIGMARIPGVAVVATCDLIKED